MDTTQEEDDYGYDDPPDDISVLNCRYSFNGHSFGNFNPSTGLALPEKSRVRWNVLAYSGDSTLSGVSLKWEGHNVINARGRSEPSLRLSSPGTAITDMRTGGASSATWLLLADREDCVSSGLSAIYSVQTKRVTGANGYHKSDAWAHMYDGYSFNYAGNNEVTFAASLVSVVAMVGMVALYIKAVRSGVIGRRMGDSLDISNTSL